MIGNHAVKFGADLRYARNLRVPSDNDRTGINNFGTGPTSNGTSGGLGFATFVLGDVTAYNRYASTSTNAKEFQKRDFFYAQDTWRATQKLTVNAGLRYEFYFPETVNASRQRCAPQPVYRFHQRRWRGWNPLQYGRFHC